MKFLFRGPVWFLLALAFSCLPAGAQTLRSLVTTSPATAPIKKLTFDTFRTEFRIENLSSSPNARNVWALGNYATVLCGFAANSLVLGCTNGSDGHGQGNASIDLAGRSDARVRYQRNVLEQQETIEVWNGDCSSYAVIKKPLTPPAPAYDASGLDFLLGGNMTISFFRAYAAIDSSGFCPVDAPLVPADLMDFRFDDNSLADASPNHLSLKASGASFADSAIYAPTALVSKISTAFKPVFKAGVPFTLDGTGSLSLTGTLSYSWAQQGGPADSVLDSANTGVVQITAPVAGQYTYRLTVSTLGGGRATVDQTVGVVATDEDGVIVNSSAEMTAILGPLTQYGTSPWPWYDIAEAADADVLAGPYATPPSEVMQPGTLTITSNVYNIVNGPRLASACRTYCGIVIQGSADTKFTKDLEGQTIFVHWDADGDGSFKGRSAQYVQTVIDAHTIMSSSYYWSEPLALSKDMTFGLAQNDIAGFRPANQSENPWNYYEANLGIYRLYYRTGLAAYQTQARTFCDIWWHYALDAGYAIPIPRNSGWQSTMACAADNHPEWWDGIAFSVESVFAAPNAPLTSPGTTDFRELSYQLRSASLVAKLYPSHAADPVATQAKWCGYLNKQISNIWLPLFSDPGYWGENEYYWTINYPLAPINGKFGTAPWRVSGLAILALEYAHESLSNPAVCNQPELADQVMNTIQKASDFLWNYGRTDDGGLYANVLYDSVQAAASLITTDQMPAGSRIQVTKGSSSLVGLSTKFTQTFAPCDGSTFIGLTAVANPGAENGVYRITECQDDTHLTVELPYPYTTETIQYYSKTVRASSTCSNSLASRCERDAYSSRNLSSDAAAGAAWLFAFTGDQKWREYALYYAGKTFGGPPGGPGSTGSVSVGPYADGGTGNLADILPSCVDHQPPCGNGFLSSMRGKPFGMSAGAGNVPVMLAHILSTTPSGPKLPVRKR